MGDVNEHPHADSINERERYAMRSATLDMAEHDPEKLRSKAVNPAADDFCKAVHESVKLRKPCSHCKEHPRPSIGALRHFSRIAKLTGETPNVVNFILNQLGAPIPEARSAVQAFNSVKGLDEEGTLDVVMPWVKDYYRRRGKRVVIVEEGDEVSVDEG